MDFRCFVSSENCESSPFESRKITAATLNNVDRYGKGRKSSTEHLPQMTTTVTMSMSMLAFSLRSQAALTEMRFPGMLCVAMPVTVGLVFRWVGSMTARPMLGAEVRRGRRAGDLDDDSDNRKCYMVVVMKL